LIRLCLARTKEKEQVLQQGQKYAPPGNLFLYAGEIVAYLL
jgi:hypothetical protein